MASDASFVAYVAGQVAGAGQVTTRRMFGEYAVYCDGKVVLLVCDNRCFLKPTAATADRVRDCPVEPPYPGAKPQPVIDELLDDAALVASLVRDTADALPAPKPKRLAVKKRAR
jgi:TfoX/Sxy family transcriptional regulator of competence genes